MLSGLFPVITEDNDVSRDTAGPYKPNRDIMMANPDLVTQTKNQLHEYNKTLWKAAGKARLEVDEGKVEEKEDGERTELENKLGNYRDVQLPQAEAVVQTTTQTLQQANTALAAWRQDGERANDDGVAVDVNGETRATVQARVDAAIVARQNALEEEIRLRAAITRTEAQLNELQPRLEVAPAIVNLQNPPEYTYWSEATYNGEIDRATQHEFSYNITRPMLHLNRIYLPNGVGESIIQAGKAAAPEIQGSQRLRIQTHSWKVLTANIFTNQNVFDYYIQGGWASSMACRSWRWMFSTRAISSTVWSSASRR